MHSDITYELLTQPTQHDLHSLAEVLTACVAGGASIGFLDPFSREHAQQFWSTISKHILAGSRLLFVARDDLGICGTVQLVLDLPDNQPHRGDVVKMLVHPRARRKGIARSLMLMLHEAALQHKRTLLVLDTVTGSPAAGMYEQLGWLRSGDIPRYALFPDGSECSTTYYYIDLASRA